jgi:hypothetical protein
MKIATYNYPDRLVPEYHTALYQLLVGVEQRHPQENLDRQASNLRRLAKECFEEFFDENGLPTQITQENRLKNRLTELKISNNDE